MRILPHVSWGMSKSQVREAEGQAGGSVGAGKDSYRHTLFGLSAKVSYQFIQGGLRAAFFAIDPPSGTAHVEAYSYLTDQFEEEYGEALHSLVDAYLDGFDRPSTFGRAFLHRSWQTDEVLVSLTLSDGRPGTGDHLLLFVFRRPPR